MKKKIVFIAVAFLSATFSQAQSFQVSSLTTDTINSTDGKGKKQGRWVFYGGQKDSSCYGKNQIVEEGQYDKGKREGQWINYYCNGNKKSVLSYKNGIPSGKLELFDTTGKMVEEGTWQNNRWVGEYKSYYPSGKLQYAFLFNEKGKRQGLQKFYYENGNVATETDFNDGFEDGIYKEYDNNGKLKTGKIYRKGKIVSEYVSVTEIRPLSFSGYGY